MAPGSPRLTAEKILAWSVLAALGAGVLTPVVGIAADALTPSQGALGGLFTAMALLAAPFVTGAMFLLTLIGLLLVRGVQGARDRS